MIVKKFFHSLRRDAHLLVRLKERREWLRLSQLPKGRAYQKSPVQFSITFDRMGDALAEAADIEEILDAKIRRIERNRTIARDLIGRLKSDKQREALTLYYLDLRRDGNALRPLTFDEVCGELGCAPGYLKKLRSRGIDAIQKLVGGDV